MKLKEIYNSKKPVISYEIFPPKGQPDEMEGKISALIQELKELAVFNPSFISVTYGAGGSTRDKTLELVLRIKNELNIKPLPHFTCVGTEKNDILAYLQEVQDAGIEDIFALRGDPPQGQEKFVKSENGFGYANELVEFIRGNTNLGIAVAGYPEGHMECESLEKDLVNLKRKVDAGADIVVTQLFYNNGLFFDFVYRARNIGIDIPIIPGILPITNFSQVERMTTMCGCTIPDELLSKLKQYQDDSDSIKAVGLEYALQQCSELISNNVPGVHFYTLNKAFAVKSVLNDLNLNTTRHVIARSETE